jgi:enoyl-CoA hydratase/carnithine racemase
VLCEKFVDRKIALVTLNRPAKLNVLSAALISQLTAVLRRLDADDDINAIVVTGAEAPPPKVKAFSAGADISEMVSLDFSAAYKADLLASWNAVSTIRKPLIGAVNGIAFGGGCELAMMLDILYASEDARFALPEIKLGTIPGVGGTQRLPRVVGKSKAMEMILTGSIMMAPDALAAGLVSRVLPRN